MDVEEMSSYPTSVSLISPLEVRSSMPSRQRFQENYKGLVFEADSLKPSSFAKTGPLTLSK